MGLTSQHMQCHGAQVVESPVLPGCARSVKEDDLAPSCAGVAARRTGVQVSVQVPEQVAQVTTRSLAVEVLP